jgi:hypothetical protein
MKQLSCSFIDEWLNTIWYIHKLECSSAIEKEKCTDTYYHMGEP